MNKKGTISQDSVNKALWSARDIVHGVANANTCTDFVFTMLFLKYLSDVWLDFYSSDNIDNSDGPALLEQVIKLPQFVLPKKADFYSLWERRHQPGNGERIDQALHAIEAVNSSILKDGDKSVFQHIVFNTDQLGTEKQKNTLLRRLLENFAKPALKLSPSHIGLTKAPDRAGEYIINHAVDCGGVQTGRLDIPPEVCKLITELLDPQPADNIYDPACGLASLLIQCGDKIRQKHNSQHYTLHGKETIGAGWSLAKMNMLMHGEDNRNIKWTAAISNPQLLDKNGDVMLFDIVLSNCLFSPGKERDDEAWNDKIGDSYCTGLPKPAVNAAFVLQMIKTLKSTGKMGVVVPHGVLYEDKVRQQLIDENLLDAVIGLPDKLFYSTDIPVMILLVKNSPSRQGGNTGVLFIDAAQEFKMDKNRHLLTIDIIGKIVSTYRRVKAVPPFEIEVSSPVCYAADLAQQAGVVVDNYAYLATFKEIKENNYNLNMSHYIESKH